MPGFVVLGVPIDSAGVAGGTELAPAALRSHGLVEAVGGEDRGDLDVAIRGRRRHPTSGVLESAQVDATTRTLRRAVAEVLNGGDRLLLIGGCCALVPGALAGCRDAAGKVGIAHLDGHLDLYDGRTSARGEAADMPLLVGLGAGPQTWVDAAGGPSLSPESTWILGYRDREQAAEDGSPMPEDFDPPLPCLTTDEIRERGPGATAAGVAASLAGTTEGFWVHVDLDIVDPAAFFANDAPLDGGLDWDELAELLGPLCASPRMLGVSLGCYNPEKDRDGRNGAEIVELLSRALG